MDESWLLHELDGGRFVWLKGAGDSGSVKEVRSGHLLYVPLKDAFCIVIMDDRSRLAITVLTEEMASKSSWAKGLDETAKLKAKRIALGSEAVHDSTFLRLYAEERGGLSINVRIKTMTHEWKPVVISLCKINIVAEQISAKDNNCLLSHDQLETVSKIIGTKISNKEIQPYCDIFVSTTNKKAVLVSNKIDGVFCLDFAENAERWLSE